MRRLFWFIRTGVDRFSPMNRLRLASLRARIKIVAAWQRAEIRVDVAPNVKVGKDVRLTVTPRTRNRICIGPRSSLGDRTLLALDGGEIVLGDLVDIRRDVVFTVSGRLSMEGRNLVQPGVAIHCDDAVTLRRMAAIGERTTIIDSVHYFTAPDDWMLDNVRTGAIDIGRNTWVGAKVTIGRNVTVGDYSVVAANALLLIDVPSGHLASGVPATVVRPVKLPWVENNGTDVKREVYE